MFQNQESVARVETVVKNETDASFQAMKWCSSDYGAGALYIFNQTIKVEVNCPEMEFSSFPLDTRVTMKAEFLKVLVSRSCNHANYF